MIKKLLLAWAAREKEKQSDRQKQFEAECKEAQDFIIDKIVGQNCIHTSSTMHYCDDCIIGDLCGELSYGASEMVCHRSRRYSK